MRDSMRVHAHADTDADPSAHSPITNRLDKFSFCLFHDLPLLLYSVLQGSSLILGHGWSPSTKATFKQLKKQPLVRGRFLSCLRRLRTFGTFLFEMGGCSGGHFLGHSKRCPRKAPHCHNHSYEAARSWTAHVCCPWSSKLSLESRPRLDRIDDKRRASKDRGSRHRASFQRQACPQTNLVI